VLKLLRPLLGGNIHLSNLTAVVAHPGAAQQHAHRDQQHLFGQPGIGPSLPIYSINMAVPLIDVDMEMGPTAVWLGSHRWEADRGPTTEPVAAVPFRRGDCMLLDYRTIHAGLSNRSARQRPIVYMVYARPWFFDHSNHLRRVPIDMPLELFEEYPGLRPLLSRALSYAVIRTWREDGANSVAAPRAAAAEAGADRAEAAIFAVGGGAAAPMPPPASPLRAAEAAPKLGDVSGRGKVGRNDPCPCGSGKKYKQCHGRLA
jgi:ectoine hydroxylase-related dioxygenase (phytanoyl-CoA dioxygenase family)